MYLSKYLTEQNHVRGDFPREGYLRAVKLPVQRLNADDADTDFPEQTPLIVMRNQWEQGYATSVSLDQYYDWYAYPTIEPSALPLDPR